MDSIGNESYIQNNLEVVKKDAFRYNIAGDAWLRQRWWVAELQAEVLLPSINQ